VFRFRPSQGVQFSAVVDNTVMAQASQPGASRTGARETPSPRTSNEPGNPTTPLHSDTGEGTRVFPRRPIIRRRWSASSSYVLAPRPRHGAPGADSTTLPARVFPGERFGRLSCEDLMETASPGMALEA
jgi:hypothetical protein